MRQALFCEHSLETRQAYVRDRRVQGHCIQPADSSFYGWPEVNTTG